MAGPIRYYVAATLLLATAACDRSPDYAAPTAPIPDGVAPLPRVTITLDERGFDVAGTIRFVTINTIPAVASWQGRRVEMESSNPNVAYLTPINPNSQATLHQLDTGVTVLRVRVDGGPYTALTVRVSPLPPTSTALVAERFSLHTFADPWAPAGTVSYMPQVRLREVTGVGKATLVGALMDMPTAPSAFCQVYRDVAPGSSTDAFGLSAYFGEPEIFFGPYAPSDSLGPVNVTLLVRDAQGTLGSIVLSKTMQRVDFSPEPLAIKPSHLSCY